jgi:hypothetical protein
MSSTVFTHALAPPTGAQLAYDNEGRRSGLQNAPTSPTTTDSFLYDGAGQRVEQSVTVVNGSITTTTTYIAGGLEESISTDDETRYLTTHHGHVGMRCFAITTPTASRRTVANCADWVFSTAHPGSIPGGVAQY